MPPGSVKIHIVRRANLKERVAIAMQNPAIVIVIVIETEDWNEAVRPAGCVCSADLELRR